MAEKLIYIGESGMSLWQFTQGKEYHMRKDFDNDEYVISDNGLRLYICKNDDGIYCGADAYHHKFREA